MNIRLVLVRFKSLMALGAAIALVMTSYAREISEVDGVALWGYDPVAYVEHRRAVKGSPAYKVEYRGSLFHFATKANHDAFLASPAKYLPQYGGYCAFFAAQGYKVAADPKVFTLLNGKLYLHYNQALQQQWLAKAPGLVALANKAWSEVSRQPQRVETPTLYDDPRFVLPSRRKRHELYL